jgi:hypothetical protein
VIQRGEEFETLEEGEASVEIKNLRVDLVTMMGHVEIRVKKWHIVPLWALIILFICLA